LGSFSNYGATNVDLAAPGDQIYSTYKNSDASYYPPFDSISVAGTSYAAAYVSGALALMRAKFPTETHQQIISRLLNATDPLPSLAGKCATGGRLNLRKALSPPIQLIALSTAGTLPFQLRVSAGPSRTCVVQVSTNLTLWSPVFTNMTSTGGTFDFTDNACTNAPRRFFRAISTL
jgi:subtilisin family serine protease